MTIRVDDGFVWAEAATGRILQSSVLREIAPHVFTTRDVSFRGPGAEADEAHLAEAFGLQPNDVVTVKQVHGRAVSVVTPGVSPTLDEADAIVSTDPARAIAVRVADCVPILLADRQRRVAAAVHAGWRGTGAGAALAAVEAIRALGIPTGDLVAAVGPSIGPCCYEVDDRVRGSFLSATPDSAEWFSEAGEHRWKLDLWQANVDQLLAAGVPADAIHVARLCTKDHPETCFSYRRDGPGAGRLVAAVRLELE
jgi:YfiH family protein